MSDPSPAVLAKATVPSGRAAGAEPAMVVSETSETLKFQCRIDGVTVHCIASREFFEDSFGANHEPASWIAAYESHLGLIHQLVAQRHRATGQTLVLLLTDYN